MPAPSKAADAMDVEENPKDKKISSEKKDEAKKEEEISEEERALKEGLELAVTRLTESDTSLHKPSIDHMMTEIRTATSSMTSVPKPLKYLRPHYNTLKEVYEGWPEQHEMKEQMADVLSVLAMTMAESNTRECLKFKLQGTKKDIARMGQEYLRSLSGEIALEYSDRIVEQGLDIPEADDLMVLVDDIIPFQMKHNAETEAVDLLIEVQKLDKLLDPAFHVDDRNFERVCLYLLKTADFIADPEDISEIFNTAFEIYVVQKKFVGALRVALKMDDDERVLRLLGDELGASDLDKKQMCHILGRHKSHIRVEDDALDAVIGNSELSETFKAVARNLDVAEAKSPEDIYKSHLAEGGASLGLRADRNKNMDSNMHNLASTFVSAFANAGTGCDTLMTPHDSGWVHKVKGVGKTSAVASLGMVMLWDIHEGLNIFDKYMAVNESELKAGACIGIGALCHGVEDDDMSFALLVDCMEGTDPSVRMGSIIGLSMSYAGQRREDLQELFEESIAERSVEESSMAALALGMVHIGTCNEDAGMSLAQKFMSAKDEELDHHMNKFLCLGLGLLYLGTTERVEAMTEIVKTVAHKRANFAEIILGACAYAGTGNVLQIQKMLRVCAEHIGDKDGADSEHQQAAVIGIALVALGEDVGTEMCLRTMDHLLHYGEAPVKRAIPLALALLYVSNPDYTVVDQLSRLSHDPDKDTAMNAIFALGILSAGTNNSRVAGMLRQLSEFYAKSSDVLFVVRVSQGLIGMAKGLVSLSPFHSDRTLLIGPALGGLLVALLCCLDIRKTILERYHFLLYYLTCAMNPRYIQTVNADDEVVPVSIRVGQSVETVGQAGRPKTISGFQTHTTPVLLGSRERAEFANTEFETMTNVLEGVVVVKPTESDDDREGKDADGSKEMSVA